MDSPHQDVYLVILNNQLAKDRTLLDAINQLSEALQLQPDEIRNILCKQSFIIESGVNLKKAKDIQTKIIKAGVGCQIKKVLRTDTIDISSLSKGTQVICAKCGKQQSVDSNCSYCGIAFSKFNPSNRATDGVSQQFNQGAIISHSRYSQNSQKSNTARNLFIGIFLLITLTFAISALKKNGQSNKHPVTLDNGQVIYAIETHTVEDIAHYKDLIVPGYITIIDFSADWCPVCKRLDKFEAQLGTGRNDNLVRKLDISQNIDFRLARKKYDLNFTSVPHSIIFGKNGAFIASDNNRQRDGQQYIHSLMDN